MLFEGVEDALEAGLGGDVCVGGGGGDFVEGGLVSVFFVVVDVVVGVGFRGD